MKIKIIAGILFILLGHTTNPLLSDEGTNEWSADGKNIAVSGDREIPETIIAPSKNVLHGLPQTWSIRDYDTFDFTSHYKVVGVFDNDGNTITFLVDGDKWKRLNDSEGLSTISDVLDLTEDKLIDIQGKPKFTNLMHDLSCIYQGYSGRALSNFFNQHYVYNADLADWVKGEGDRSKGIHELRSLCGENVEIGDNNFKFAVNFANSRGGIDHWEVAGLIKKYDMLLLTSIVVTKVEPDGTFNYPICGDF